MSDEKIKVSELPEQEQKELIAEAYAVGLTGIFTGWKVSTLKNKIAEQKAQTVDEKEGENEQAPATDEQNGTNDEQKDGEGEQTTEEMNKADAPAPEETKKATPKKAEKPEPKYDGICHICRSKVISGVCTGCGFHK